MNLSSSVGSGGRRLSVVRVGGGKVGATEGRVGSKLTGEEEGTTGGTSAAVLDSAAPPAATVNAGHAGCELESSEGSLSLSLRPLTLLLAGVLPPPPALLPTRLGPAAPGAGAERGHAHLGRQSGCGLGALLGSLWRVWGTKELRQHSAQERIQQLCAWKHNAFCTTYIHTTLTLGLGFGPRAFFLDL